MRYKAEGNLIQHC